MTFVPRDVAAVYGVIVVAIGLSIGVSETRAQIAVDLQLPKRDFIAYEPVNATVTVYNRSGRDVVLGGPSGTSWLQFQVMDYAGNLMTPIAGGAKMDPVMLPALGNVPVTVDLSEVYPIFDYGIYRFQASVFYPPTQQFYDSERKSLNMADGKVIWGPVQSRRPAGYQGRGMERQFTLLKYRATEATEIYVRVTDSKTGAVYATYSLGEVLLHVDPQATTDRDGNLHVLFYGTPQYAVHNIIGFTGKSLKRDIYKATTTSRPEMLLSETGQVGIRGGILDDPKARAAREPTGVRSLSERPPLPGQ
ncbi:MAG: hypothetical protein AAGD22_03965 [Verrucomicrobiota bacterium]